MALVLMLIDGPASGSEEMHPDGLAKMIEEVFGAMPPDEAAKRDDLRTGLEHFVAQVRSGPHRVVGSYPAAATGQQGAASLGAPPQVSAADLTVNPSIGGACSGGGAFQQGQLVQIMGDGFLPGATVTEKFAAGDFEAPLGTTTATGSGTINDLVVIPTGFAVPTLGILQADGASPSGLRSLSAMIDVGAAGAADSDGDGIPDFCDNCSGASNPGQEDDDSDGVGNACDTCPNDVMNDEDGDGLCSENDSCPFDPDNDTDADGVCGDIDNCPNDTNPFQEDIDRNGVGNACQTQPSCNDGVDNDGDGVVDFPTDPGCASTSDSSEGDPALVCDDGIDNDSDGLIDFRTFGAGDPGCSALTGPSESPECDDSIDNDGDGHIDWDGNFGLVPADMQCGQLGSHDSELVPEPSQIVSAAAGLILLRVLTRRRGAVRSPPPSKAFRTVPKGEPRSLRQHPPVRGRSPQRARQINGFRVNDAPSSAACVNTWPRWTSDNRPYVDVS